MPADGPFGDLKPVNVKCPADRACPNRNPHKRARAS